MTDQISLFDALTAAQLTAAAHISASGRAEGLARMDAARAHARLTDPATSHRAAQSITDKALSDARRSVLDLLELIGPATDTAMLEGYDLRRVAYLWPHQSPSGLRSRRAELVLGGLVYDTGRRTILISGRQSIVWAVR